MTLSSKRHPEDVAGPQNLTELFWLQQSNGPPQSNLLPPKSPPPPPTPVWENGGDCAGTRLLAGSALLFLCCPPPTPGPKISRELAGRSRELRPWASSAALAVFARDCFLPPSPASPPAFLPSFPVWPPPPSPAGPLPAGIIWSPAMDSPSAGQFMATALALAACAAVRRGPSSALLTVRRGSPQLSGLVVPPSGPRPPKPGLPARVPLFRGAVITPLVGSRYLISAASRPPGISPRIRTNPRLPLPAPLLWALRWGRPGSPPLGFTLLVVHCVQQPGVPPSFFASGSGVRGLPSRLNA